MTKDETKTNLQDSPALAIIRDRSLPEFFTSEVLAEAGVFNPEPEPEVIAAELARGRRDLRGRRIITIDGEDARDLDDAVEVESIPGGRYRLGVHIADVSHYVAEGSALDREALQRGTSVYLADQVIPMLPPRLSNGICSLNPGVDRLTLSVVLTIGPDGETEAGEVIETVIHSLARTTYTEVRQALETESQPSGRYAGYLDDLRLMKRLADLLALRRRQRGSIDFEFPETHVVVNDMGQPQLIEPYPLSFANGIIEEFMIAANEFVARHYFFLKMPFLYRIHEMPDKEKLGRFLRLAATFGVKARIRGTPQPGQLADILDKVRHEPFGTTLSELLLRSLAKARYSAENAGHFGLASEYYCHFTSPIRRYPDLFIHRVIKASLHGKVERKRWQAAAPLVAEHSSDMERAATQAERDSTAQMAAIYMSSRLGEVYEGLVSGFGPAGIYVRLASTIEGLVPFRSLPWYLVIDEERMIAAERSGGHTFHLGDAVEVQVARADAVLRQIDFEMLSHRGAPLIQPMAKGRPTTGAKLPGGKGSKKKSRGMKTAAGNRTRPARKGRKPGKSKRR